MVYLSKSEGKYRIIQLGTGIQLCKDMDTKEGAIASLSAYPNEKLIGEAWNGESGVLDFVPLSQI